MKRIKNYIYVTHNQEEARILSTKVLLFNNGKVEGFDKYEILYNNPPNLFVAEFLGLLNKLNSIIIYKKGLYYLNIYNKQYLLDEQIYDYNKLKKYINKEVILGIRPSDIKISDKGINVKVNSMIDFPLYKRYFVKNNDFELIVESNIKINNDVTSIAFDKNIMIFDEKSLERIK